MKVTPKHVSFVLVLMGVMLVFSLAGSAWAQAVVPLGPKMGNSSEALPNEPSPQTAEELQEQLQKAKEEAQAELQEAQEQAEEQAQAPAPATNEASPPSPAPMPALVAPSKPAKKKKASLRLSSAKPYGFKKNKSKAQKKFKSALSKARACVKDASSMRTGTVKVAVRVNIKGKAFKSTVKNQSIGDAKAAQCIAKSFQRLGSFPKPDSGMAGADVTFKVTVK